jgi:4a-hydroxytetrahydrobiopterin dehydratase
MNDRSKEIKVAAIKGAALKNLTSQLGQGWKVIDEHHLEKEYRFHNFSEALAFTNDIGKLAEEEGHHPDILLGWGKVTLTYWTHKLGGLSEEDFKMAAKSDICYLSRFGK